MGTLKKNNKKHKVQKHNLFVLVSFFRFYFHHHYIIPQFYAIQTLLCKMLSSVIVKIEYNSPQDASSLSPTLQSNHK